MAFDNYILVMKKYSTIVWSAVILVLLVIAFLFRAPLWGWFDQNIVERLRSASTHNKASFDQMLFTLDKLTRAEELVFEIIRTYNAERPVLEIKGKIGIFEEAFERYDRLIMDENVGVRMQYLQDYYTDGYRDFVLAHIEFYEGLFERLNDGPFDAEKLEQVKAEMREANDRFLVEHQEFTNHALEFYGMKFLPF